MLACTWEGHWTDLLTSISPDMSCINAHPASPYTEGPAVDVASISLSLDCAAPGVVVTCFARVSDGGRLGSVSG